MTKKPKCILVTGQPGAGKTTLARQLGAQLQMPLVSRDEIKEGYVNTFGASHDELPVETNKVVTDLFFDLLRHYLTGRVSIVVEAAFQHHVWENRMPQLRELGEVWMVACLIDAETAAQRHLQRGLNDPNREHYHGDNRVTHFKATGEVLPPSPFIAPRFDVPTIEVSTVGEYDPPLDEIVRRIQSS